MNDYAGYLQGNLEHHLDHLAPFCSLMGWPLVVTEEEIFELAQLYYPDLQVHLLSPLEAPFEVTKSFKTVVTTLPRIAFDEIFFIAEATLGKRLRTLWLPHGNSDKGHLLPWMEALNDEETLLVYGPKMIDFLKEKNVLAPQQICIGNFRYTYFQKHRSFYGNLLDSLDLKSPFILYAPTWKDAENSSSFEMVIEALQRELKGYPLVIKPHPNQAGEAHTLQQKFSSAVRWLDRFPPIYPLLERTSHLIGDYSSIGYDFLRFNRPLIFFNPSDRAENDPGRFLHLHGVTLKTSEVALLPQYLAQGDQLETSREKLYHYTFGPERAWDQIATEVKRLDI